MTVELMKAVFASRPEIPTPRLPRQSNLCRESRPQMAFLCGLQHGELETQRFFDGRVQWPRRCRCHLRRGRERG